MRKIENEMVRAIKMRKEWANSNTRIERGFKLDNYETFDLYLHGNLIATIEHKGKDSKIALMNGGWFSNTTKSRLNAILEGLNIGYKISQRDFTWYYIGVNGETLEFRNGKEFAYRW